MHDACYKQVTSPRKFKMSHGNKSAKPAVVTGARDANKRRKIQDYLFLFLIRSIGVDGFNHSDDSGLSLANGPVSLELYLLICDSLLIDIIKQWFQRNNKT